MKKAVYCEFLRSLGFHRADERSEGRSARGMGFEERLRLERWLRIIRQLLSNHWCVKCQTRVYTGVYCPSKCPSLARYCMIVPSLSWQIVVYPITVTTIHIAFQWKKESAILPHIYTVGDSRCSIPRGCGYFTPSFANGAAIRGYNVLWGGNNQYWLGAE